MAKSRATRSREKRRNLAACRKVLAEREEHHQWLLTNAPACLGGNVPWPMSHPQGYAWAYFHWAGTIQPGFRETHQMAECHRRYGKTIGEEMPGSLSDMAAPRVRWARCCVFCTADLKEREDQAFARTDIPPGKWAQAWGSAVLYRPDGFRVCWVCVGDFTAVGQDPKTMPLPDGVDVRTAPLAQEPIKAAEWTAGYAKGQVIKL